MRLVPTPPSTELLRGVIFDMDGVIVDSHPAHRKAWRQFLQTLGRNVTDRELDFILDGRKRRDILRHFLGQVSEAELVEYGKRKDEFFQQSAAEVTPIPGVTEFLIRLNKNGVVAAVATSASEARTRSTLERLQLRNYFSVVLTGNDVENGKPDPAIYRLACRRLNARPESVLAIEDAVSGIQAARGAGLKCLGLTSDRYAEKLRGAGAVHIIRSFVGLSLKKLEVIFNQVSCATNATGSEVCVSKFIASLDPS
jgi:beta-phosphoglucomutase